MNWQSLCESIQPYLIVWANGFLAISYWVWDNAALLIALACGLAILLVYDRAVQRTAGDRLMRYERGVRVQASYRSQVESIAASAVWAIASVVSASPIPSIGAAMWATFLLALKMIPQEREGLLFRHKIMIAFYGLIVIAVRLATSFVPNVGQMATMLNGRGDASLLFDTVRDGMLPYTMLTLWLIYPLGYFTVLGERFVVNRGSLLRPGGTPEDVLRDLRTRGER